MNRTIDILKIIYALFYLVIGLRGIVAYLGLMPTPNFDMSDPARQFQNALAATGFVMEIVSAVFFVAGTLMLFKRTTPLGLILLAPLVVVILFNHLMLQGSAIWGVSHAVLLAVFAWSYRDAFSSLWNYSADR
ncbi:hypothetical protein FE810_13130 [Thalassotalea litorea]|uniref:DoxX family protein n=1 Tax=Thalassotalea litorea TaxID=2020715 RepID=A0A5R9IHF2_9GAMM|nr:hypothetical protein [Thalassotalea litorea]TLU61994.1 hypothetical protein FE810_13130 [Thalassotalea litorea]